jgi:hypothetical protein
MMYRYYQWCQPPVTKLLEDLVLTTLEYCDTGAARMAIDFAAPGKLTIGSCDEHLKRIHAMKVNLRRRRSVDQAGDQVKPGATSASLVLLHAW